MSNIESLVSGLSQGLTGYLQGKQNLQNQEALKAAPGPAQPDTGDDDPVLTPQMAETALPGYGSNIVNDYNQKNPGKPLKLSQGVAYIKAASDALAKNTPDPDAGPTKAEQYQDKLTNDWTNHFNQVRGDQSLMRTENQRDASAMGYRTITKAQSEGRDLSSMEQSDVLGQLWRARTGASPTNEVMKDLNNRTAQSDFNHVAAYVTGDPTIVGSSTKETMDNMKQFLDDTGRAADAEWSGYMSPKTTRPSGIDDAHWQKAQAVTRGLTYADQKSVSDKTYPIKKLQAPPKDVTGWKIIQ